MNVCFVKCRFADFIVNINQIFKVAVQVPNLNSIIRLTESDEWTL